MCLTLIGVVGSLLKGDFDRCFVGVVGIGLSGSGVVDRDCLFLCGSGLFDRDLVGSYIRKCCA